MASNEHNEDNGCFNWQLSLEQRMTERYVDQRFTDITFICSGGRVCHAHRVILYGQSALIDRKIDGLTSRLEGLNIDFQTYPVRILHNCIRFFYGRIIELLGSPDTLVKMYRFAVEAEAPGLQAAIEDCFRAGMADCRAFTVVAAYAVYECDSPTTQTLRDIVVAHVDSEFREAKLDVDIMDAIMDAMDEYPRFDNDVALALQEKTENPLRTIPEMARRQS